MGDIVSISPKNIDYPSQEYALRKPPSPEDPDWANFLAFKETTSARGAVDNIFSVRQKEDGRYEALDGSRRLTVCKMLCEEGDPNFQTVNVQVLSVDEKEALIRQIAGNAGAKKTPNGAYIKALEKVFIHEGGNIKSIAARIGMSEGYIKQLLKIPAMPSKIQQMIDDEKLSISHVLLIQRLPSEYYEDSEVLEKACSMSAQKFAPVIEAKLSDIRKLKKAEKSGEEPVFTPVAKMMKKDEMLIELERAINIHDDEPNDYNRGYLDALQKVFHLDAESVNAQEAEWNSKQESMKAAREARKAEREAKKAAEYAKYLKDKGIKSLDEIEIPEE